LPFYYNSLLPIFSSTDWAEPPSGKILLGGGSVSEKATFALLAPSKGTRRDWRGREEIDRSREDPMLYGNFKGANSNESFWPSPRKDMKRLSYSETKMASDSSKRRQMRHSAWTLWLVPLVVPLLLLLVPGSREPLNRDGTTAEQVDESSFQIPADREAPPEFSLAPPTDLSFNSHQSFEDLLRD
jgi:hypothetical protein